MIKGESLIILNERWKLQDLSVLTKEYMQLYGLYYVLRAIDEGWMSEIDMQRKPWLGGGTVVGFFSFFGKLVHPSLRPEVKRIQYASPGFIELTLAVDVAKDIGIIVSTLSGAIASISGLYHLIYSQYQKRQLTQLKIKDLEAKQLREEIYFVKKSVQELHSGFNLTNSQIQGLHKLSKGDELIQLKMLLALYRRAKPISDLQLNNKVNFTNA